MDTTDKKTRRGFLKLLGIVPVGMAAAKVVSDPKPEPKMIVRQPIVRYDVRLGRHEFFEDSEFPQLEKHG